MWEFRGGKNDYFLIRVSSVFDRLKLVIVTENSMKNGKYILYRIFRKIFVYIDCTSIIHRLYIDCIYRK